MISYTTPTHAHVVRGIDLTGCDVYVSYQQGIAQANIKGETSYDGSDTTVTVSLTQRQTARFKEGKATVQINWVYPNGKRDATTKKEIDVLDNLYDREIAHAG